MSCLSMIFLREDPTSEVVSVATRTDVIAPCTSLMRTLSRGNNGNCVTPNAASFCEHINNFHHNLPILKGTKDGQRDVTASSNTFPRR